jgi:hypothetical protein
VLSTGCACPWLTDLDRHVGGSGGLPFFRLPRVSGIPESEAVRIAHQALAERGIEWDEPHRVKKGWRNWRILTPSNRRGGNSEIKVSRKTGAAKVRRYVR